MDILIVDDDKDARLITSKILAAAGHRVREVANGEQALEILSAGGIDLIVSDILMPVMDGFHLCRKVKFDAALQKIPFIFYTATYTGPLDEEFARKIGADGFICKPCEPEAFLKAVQGVMEAEAADPHAAKEPAANELEVLTLYNERLVRKLEQKMLQLEQEVDRRQRIEATLRDNLRFLQTLIDTIPNPIFYKDPQGRYLGGNRAWAEGIVGLPLKDIVGRGTTELKAQIPSDLAAIYHEQDMALIENPGRQEYEAPVKSADGRMLDFIINKATFFDSDGRIAGIVGSMLDISKRKEAESKRLELEKHLQQAQKMEAVGAMAGGIAHDFNNILSAIVGYADLTRNGLRESCPEFEYVSNVLAAAYRARDLVRQILTFSRQTEHERIPMAPHLVVKEALSLLRSTLPATIEIRQNTAPAGTILGDPTQIHQVVMNLCTNAFHAMKETGGLLEVGLQPVTIDPDTIGQHPDLAPGSYIRLSVSDTGCGMTPEVLRRIFDPYFTTKPEGEGTGLGLSVIHGIVKSHGGGISAYSEPGKGSSFHVYLPRIDPIGGELKETGLSPMPMGTERILLVDDEPTLVELGKRMLQMLGYQVTTHTSGSEALALFRASPASFDLVITDMTMPRMTGAELSRELLLITPDLPIILCTGFSYAISEKTAREIGIRGFAMKPLIMRDLAKLIRNLLDGEK